MPSAYILAKDRIQQARAMLANDIWFDAVTDHLFEVALARLDELDAGVFDDAGKRPETLRPAMPARVRLMPWLDR
ncbi:MAG TPA: hypothetical protein VNS12_13765 [Pelagibacterium sp.]|uniref:hypothetical protein n=1 Tax=Pelagibacterium sp. TaxID=1967288 RepID=UPI002BD112EF|nr:hypothetical protein [Pelagibacterium sp.]HWJ89130.1 hypothetical protein [Pelagibacterium sp.]